MLTDDYIIRMINLAVAALLRIIGLKDSGDYQEALLLIDLTFERLLGLRASMAKNLDDGRLYFLLTRQDRLDTQRLAIVADLFHQEADVYTALGRPAEAREDYIRALRYTLEVLFNGAGEELPELHQKVAVLLESIDLAGVGADTLWPLAGYYEETGAYTQAEAVLRILVERPETRAEILPELRAFYQRLLEKPPAELAHSGLTRAQVQERLAKLS